MTRAGAMTSVEAGTKWWQGGGCKEGARDNKQQYWLGKIARQLCCRSSWNVLVRDGMRGSTPEACRVALEAGATAVAVVTVVTSRPSQHRRCAEHQLHY